MKQFENLALLEKLRSHFKLSSGQHFVVGMDFCLVLNIPSNPFSPVSGFAVFLKDDREKFLVAKSRFLADPNIVFYSGDFDRLSRIK